MATATMTSKGQITVPVEVREKLGLKAGTRVEFVETEKGEFVIVPATLHVSALEGIFYDPNRKPVSIEEMNEAISHMGDDKWLDEHCS